METLKYKIPLRMYSWDERDPIRPSCCLVLEMPSLDITKIYGISSLSGLGCWIRDWGSEKDHRWEERAYGFSIKTVVMDVRFSAGYYIAEFLSDLPLETIVTRNCLGRPETMTLKEAIKDFLDGCLMDGIGENEIGQVEYNSHKYDVWLGRATEIV